MARLEEAHAIRCAFAGVHDSNDAWGSTSDTVSFAATKAVTKRDDVGDHGAFSPSV